MYRSEPEAALERPQRLLAARQAARRVGLDQCDGATCADCVRTTTTGRHSAIPAGLGTTCCRTSRRSRRARRTSAPTRIRCAARSSTRASSSACRATTTSMATTRKASVTTASRCTTGRANRRRRLTCVPARGRKNLVVETNALATRIGFDGTRAVERRRGPRDGALANRTRKTRSRRMRGRRQHAAAPAALGRGTRVAPAVARDRRGREIVRWDATCRTTCASTISTARACRRSTKSCGRGTASLRTGLQYVLATARPARDVGEPGGRLRALACRTRSTERAALLLAAVVHARNDRQACVDEPGSVPGISAQRAAVPARRAAARSRSDRPIRTTRRASCRTRSRRSTTSTSWSRARNSCAGSRPCPRLSSIIAEEM